MYSFRSIAAEAAALLWLAHPAFGDWPLKFTNIDDYTALAAATNGFPSQTFRSSDIVAPVFLINTWEKNQTDDAPYILMGTVYGHKKAGPMIFDARDLSLIYADQQYDNTYSSNVEVINGTSYLAFWQGGHTRGHANGDCLLFDENYNLRYNVTAKGLGDARADMHEMKITKSGTVIFSTYFIIPYDCRSVGGAEDAFLMDSGFQEVDPVTNELLFDWAASKWFNISDTFARYRESFGVAPGTGFDFFHINSIDKTDDGNYLVSSRHMSLLTLIDGKDGHPLWILGGRQNQFADLSVGKATNFSWQHDARFFRGDKTQITMFDNHGEHTGRCREECLTRALRIAIDPAELTARLVSEFFHPQGIDSGAMGGYQALGNGNVLTGWGYNPGIVEYAGDGTPVMDIQRGVIGGKHIADMFAYRVKKGHWTGRPAWPPSVAADAPARSTVNATIYLSWNGATDVASWVVFASNDTSTLNNYDNIIADSPRKGFETTIPLGQNVTAARYLGAAAVSTSGSVLGSTIVVDLENYGQPVILTSNISSVTKPKAKKKKMMTFGRAGVLVVLILVPLGVFYAGAWYWRGRTARASTRSKDGERGYKLVSTMEQRGQNDIQ